MVEKIKSIYPQCEVCWIEENSKWEPDSVSDDGKLIARLTGIALPMNPEVGSVNICCTCGNMTVVGIYVEKFEDEIQHNVDPLEITPFQ